MSQLKSNEEIVEHYAELFGYEYKGDFALHCNHLREILAQKDAELQKAREEEKSRILKLALTMGDCPINNPEAGAGWMKFQHDFCLKLTKDNKETILSENDHSELDQDNK